MHRRSRGSTGARSGVCRNLVLVVCLAASTCSHAGALDGGAGDEHMGASDDARPPEGQGDGQARADTASLDAGVEPHDTATETTSSDANAICARYCQRVPAGACPNPNCVTQCLLGARDPRCGPLALSLVACWTTVSDDSFYCQGGKGYVKSTACPTEHDRLGACLFGPAPDGGP